MPVPTMRSDSVARGFAAASTLTVTGGAGGGVEVVASCTSAGSRASAMPCFGQYLQNQMPLPQRCQQSAPTASSGHSRCTEPFYIIIQ